MGTVAGSADGQPWSRAGEIVSSLQLPAMDAMASAKEISFRRLLYSTEQQLAGCQADARGDIAAGEPLEFTPSLAKLKHSLSTLEDQLVDLGHMQGGLRLSSEKLALYRQHLKQLAMRLPVIRVPRYCVRPAPKTTAPPTNSLPALAIPTKGLFEPTSTGSAGSAGNHSQVSTVGPSLKGDKLSAAAKQSLATQELIQADLTDQLTAMTGSLLQNARTTAAAVQEREGLVDNVGQKVDASLVGTKDLVQKSSVQYKRSSGGFCLTCMILLMVGMVFTGMVVYVKLTYFVGYRAPKGAHQGVSIWSSVYDTCVQGVSGLMQLIPGRRDGNDEL